MHLRFAQVVSNSRKLKEHPFIRCGTRPTPNKMDYFQLFRELLIISGCSLLKLFRISNVLCMDISFSVEQDLICRARAGDDDAFEQLVKLFTPDLFRVIRRMTADMDETEAIIQEAFWRIWQALPRYKGDRRFFPYLVTVAANLVRDAWRKQRRILPDEFDAVSNKQDTSPLPETQVEEAELLQILSKSVEGLSPIHRVVIALRYDAEMSYAEIAALLNLPVNTVRTHLYRAKLALHQTLKEAYG